MTEVLSCSIVQTGSFVSSNGRSVSFKIAIAFVVCVFYHEVVDRFIEEIVICQKQLQNTLKRLSQV